MNIQEELETLRASESIKHANLQELARLVLAAEDSIGKLDDDGFALVWAGAVALAKGVAQ